MPAIGDRSHARSLRRTPPIQQAVFLTVPVAVTDIIERGYGKTFYLHDPNGIRLQIELKTKQDANSLEGDPDPVPYVRAFLQRA